MAIFSYLFQSVLPFYTSHIFFLFINVSVKNRSFLIKFGWLIFLPFFTVACVASQKSSDDNSSESSDSAPLKVIEYDSNIDSFTLENGLDVILWSRGQNAATFKLLIHSGSLQENDDQLGYAHFVEHMVFNQINDQGERPIQEKLDSLGLNMGQHANAFTYFDHTEYTLSIKQNDPGKSLQALDLLTSFAFNTQFDLREVEKEKPIIIEEWRLRNPDNNSSSQQRVNDILKDSRYFNRFPIGTLDSIKRTTAEKLHAYYSRHYRADNATLIVTGNMDMKQLKRLIEERFQGWKSSGEGKSSGFSLPKIKNTGAFIYTDEKISEHVLMRSHTFDKSFFNSQSGIIQWDQLTALLAIFNDRVKHRLVETQGNVASIFAELVFDPATYRSSLNFSAISNADGVSQASQIILDEIAKMVKYGVHGKEWFSWRKKRLDTLSDDFNFSDNLAFVASKQALNNGIMLSEKSYVRLLTDAHLNAELVDLQKLAATFFSLPSKIILMHKQGESAPSKDALLGYFSRSTEHIRPGKALFKNIQWPLLKAPGSILEKTKVAHGIVEYQLSNGLLVRLYETQEEQNNVALQLVGLGGLNEMSEDDVLAARLATSVMGASGLRDMTGSELKDWLSNSNIGLAHHFTFNSRELEMRSSTEDLAVLLRLMHIALTEVKVNPDVFAHIQKLNIDQLRQMSQAPTNAFSLRAESVLTNNDPAFRRMTVDEVSKIDAKRMSNIYETYFKGTQNYVLTIVGDIAPEQLEPLLVNSVANIPQTLAQRRAPRGNPIAPASITVEGNGANVNATGVTIIKTLSKHFFSEDFHPDVAWIQQHFNQVLFNEIREEQGLVYAINVLLEGDDPSSVAYSLRVDFSTDPTKAKQVIEQINNVLLKASETRPTVAELKDSLIEARRNHTKSLDDIKTLSRLLAGAEFQGLSLDTIFSAKDYIPERGRQSTHTLMSELLSDKSIDTTFILNP